MFLNTTRIGFFIAAVFLLTVFATSCGGKSRDGEEPVARVNDSYLYISDLYEIVPENTSPADSVALVNEYIDNWIRKQLLIAQAEKNLPKEEKDFSRQIEEYRSSLLIYRYEQELVRQKLDTVVGDDDIRKYYEENKNGFLLSENIVKVAYIKLLRKTNPSIAASLLKSEKPADRDKLRDYCSRNAVNYFLEDDTWLLFNDILKEIPIKTYNQEEYLKNNRFIEIQDSAYTYLLNIKGFMIRESPSPLSFEAENIRSIIINRRKLALIEEMRKSIYREALEKGSFEVYVKSEGTTQ